MPKESRYKALSYCSAALVLAMVAAIAPATAQFPPAPEDQPAAKGKRGGATAAPSINGNWSGQLTQVGSQKPYNFELAISAKGAETKYPDLDCTGKLTRVGSSKSYVFYTEAITRAKPKKAVAVRTAPSPSRGKGTISRSAGSAAFKALPSSPTAR